MKKTFPDISSKTWEHPADTAALAAVKKIPALDELLKRFISATTEKSLRLIALASSVRVTERQFPRLNRLLEEACMVLDVREPPELFVSQSPILNAGAVGVDHPFITLNSSIIEQFSDKEMLVIISHELGHILSGHVLYKTLLWMLLKLSSSVIPVGKMVLSGLIAALKEWDRKSELSADRAALLASQEVSVSYNVLMKIAGGANEGEMSLEEFFVQADEYEKNGDMLDSMHKLLNVLGESHPFAVLRLKELKVWHDSGAYEKILSGEYRRRGGEEEEDVRKTFERAAGSYREEFERSQDPLAGTLRDLGKRAEAAGQQVSKQADDFLRGVFGGKNPFEGGPFGGNPFGGGPFGGPFGAKRGSDSGDRESGAGEGQGRSGKGDRDAGDSSADDDAGATGSTSRDRERPRDDGPDDADSGSDKAGSR